jgi:alkylation response protein AidB-like acyl-CoA dehydrogenase
VSDPVADARAMAPLVTRHREQIEAERCLPRPLFEALREAGFFRLWVPGNLGGAELDPETSFEIVEELSRQDGAVGWSVMIAGNNSVLWGYLESGCAAKLMHGNGSTVLAGSILGGSGTATACAGGYRITGRWPFASGCDHAEYMVAGCRLAEQPDQVRGFIFPVQQARLLDTWYTAGLRGTASHDFTVADVFVPHGNDFPFPSPGGCQPGPLYNTPIPNVWAPNISGVALGIARDALETFIGIATAKRSVLSSTVLSQRETIQERVGQCEALLRQGRAFLLEAMRANWQTLCAGKPLSDEQSALVRLAASTAVKNAVDVVDALFEAAGSTGIYTRSRLERCFRDVHMVPQHAVVGPAALPMAGRVFLGMGLSR